jgi:peptidase C10-like protein/Spi protease inhibitor/type IX secretion system substrate protein
MNKFIKIAGALLFSVCTCTASFAKVVDENTAKTIGSNYLISENVPGVNGASDLVTSYVATGQTPAGVVNDFYVFNVQGGIGFVMVSADDNVRPILAFSNHSSFDFSAMSPEAKFWIEGYQNQITAFISNNAPAKAGTAQMWKDLAVAKTNAPSAKRTTSLFPSSTVYLLKTKWDQEPGYNNYCPPGTPTGCVATSTAQVMEFWNWPTVGCGYHSYTCPVFGVKSADFSNTAYNWTKMNSSLTTYNSAIDTLMFHVGVAVNMDYTTSSSGSGAYTTIASTPAGVVNCSEYALKTYFHYMRSLRGLGRNVGQPSEIPEATWISTLKTEMDNGRPVLYSGSGVSGGHAWVCDGYNSTSLFHMNWGWSGSGPDGWYTVDNLNPPTLGIGGGTGAFNQNQDIIIGIQPDKFPASTPGNIQLAAHLDCGTSVSNPMPYAPSSLSITTKISNTGSSAFNGDFCVQIFDTNLVYLGTIQTMTGQSIAAGATSAALTFASTTAMLQMIPGYYNVRILYRPTGTTTWTPVADNGVFINDNVLTVGNNQAMELASAITVSTGTTIKQGKPVSITTSISNQTSGAFNGSVQAVLTNVSTAAVTNIQLLTGQSIFYSATDPFSFGGTIPSTLPIGTYTLAIQHQPGGTGAFVYTGSDVFENPIIVNVVSAAGINTPSAVSEKIAVYPNPANSIITISMDDVTVSKIRITDIMGHEVQTLYPNTQPTMAISVNNYAAGIYFVNLYTGDEVVTKKIVVTK